MLIPELWAECTRWADETGKWVSSRAQGLGEKFPAFHSVEEVGQAQAEARQFVQELTQKKREWAQKISQVRNAYDAFPPRRPNWLGQGGLSKGMIQQEKARVLGVMKKISVDLFDSTVVNARNLLLELDTTIKHAKADVKNQRIETASASISSRRLEEAEKAPKAQNDSDSTAKPRELGEVLDELNSLTGLRGVKKEIEDLVNFLKVQTMRKAQRLPPSPIALHSVFYGNPGTGKTTVARLISQIYQSLGFLSKGHLVETDRAGLVAGYVGQTALKVSEVVTSALGGVLFIDEAYALSSGEGQDYGNEAISTLLKQMEDHRTEFVVIVAGYADKMEAFISSNPGLRSRFTRYLRFDDYTPVELGSIFGRFAKREGYDLSESATKKLQSMFEVAYACRDATFGNARLARNLFEVAIGNQANRIVSLPNPEPALLSMIEESDLPNVLGEGFQPSR